MKKIIYILSVFIISGFTSIAQNILSIDDAIKIALKNNYDIIIAGNSAKIDSVNNTSGNAGMLPTISLNAGGTYQLNNLHQEASSGAITEYNPQAATILSANIELNWTVYDGSKMFVTKEKLKQIQALGEINFKNQVSSTIYSIIAKYYEIVKQNQQLKSIREVMNYNTERAKIFETAFTAGTNPKTDYLQAKIDLNQIKQSIISQEYTINALKKEFTTLLGMNKYEDFSVTDSISISLNPDKNSLYDKLDKTNLSIAALNKQLEIAKSALDEIRSEYLPKLAFKTGYYLSNTNNSEGSMLVNRNIGPAVNLNLSFPIFSAGETKRKITASEIGILNNEYGLLNLKNQLKTQMDNLLMNFQNQKEMLDIETENISLTKEYLDLCTERLKYGRTTSLEVHLAQENYVQSFTRYLNFKYNLKLVEAKILQLISEL